MKIYKKPYLNNIITALITPFNLDNTINYKHLFELINFQIYNKIFDFVFFGTTGENFLLNDYEKKEFLNKILSEYEKKINIIIGIFENDYRKCINYINYYSYYFKIENFLVSNPFYLTSDQEGIYEFYFKISKSVNSNIILYNNPFRSSCNIDGSTAKKIFYNCPNIIGIKNSVKNINKNLEMIKITNSFKNFFFCGDDFNLLVLLKNYIKGIISCFSNIFPKLYFEIFNSYLNNDFLNLELLINQLIDNFYILRKEKNPVNTKCLLYFLFNIENYFRIPLSNKSFKYLINLKKKIKFFNLL